MALNRAIHSLDFNNDVTSKLLQKYFAYYLAPLNKDVIFLIILFYNKIFAVNDS